MKRSADVGKSVNHNMSELLDKRLRRIQRPSMFAHDPPPPPSAVNNSWIRRPLLANMSACIINSNAERLYCLPSIHRQHKHSAARRGSRPPPPQPLGPGPRAQPRTHLDLLWARCTVSGFTVRS